ncbi:cytochrome c3 family protein, partial [Planctomycetota bacterium]
TTCNLCHESARPSDPHPQGIDCASCHNDPGGSWAGATWDHDPPPTTCTLCHEESRPESQHPQRTDCANCHYDPGGSWAGAVNGPRGS